jgi:anti-sigma-K factor RskA
VNIKEYISSGIVESYVLGLADEADRAGFEQMCDQHPEILAAREAFELELEQFAMANAVAAPQQVRTIVLDRTIGSADMPLQPVGAEEDADAPVVAMRSSARYVAAASVVLLVGSAVLNFYFFNKYKEYSSRYDQLLAQQTELVKNNNNLQTRLNTYENTIAQLSNPNMKVIKMAGNEVPSQGSPDSTSMAMIYWDTRSKDVYLMVHHLPQPTADKQYQLWAIVNGQPVDAGVFDMNNQSGLMVKMKNIPEAQLFAVTLEQKGGSPTPKGPMYVLGKT